jgi:hypothetical protein
MAEARELEPERLLEDTELLQLAEFTDYLMRFTATVWHHACPENRIRLQTAIFPKGVNGVDPLVETTS